MKKLAILMMLALFAFSSVLMAEMTADEIINKHLAAIGAENGFKDIKSIAMKGSMFVSGMPLDFKSYIVMPDKAYMEASTNNTVMFSGGTNGDAAWQVSPMGAVLLEGEDKKSAMEQTELSKFVDYKAKGSSVEYLGEDLVKGAATHKIQLIDQENDTSLYFIDAETFYVVREKSGMNTVTFSKHEKVGDKIVQPFKVNITGSSPQGQVMITFDSMELNVEVPDSLFVKPENAIPMSEMQKQMQQMQQQQQGSGN